MLAGLSFKGGSVSMKMHTDCEVVFFVSSSGHCTLECHYCIIDPVAKMEQSLDSSDMSFLLDAFNKKAFLAFSGKGDFFAGYKKSHKFLKFLLARNLEMGLDINGVLIHEFPELSEKELGKIRFINLTMHYQQIKERHLRALWAENARILIRKKGSDMLLGTIVSPTLRDSWEESLGFYEKEIFKTTGKQITLIKDIKAQFNENDETFLARLQTRFSTMVASVHQEDFAASFRSINTVLCPAGRNYFRIWNSGDVQGCPMISGLAHCGNIKDRNIVIKGEFFRCSEPMYCDCNIIEGLGKMVHE